MTMLPTLWTVNATSPLTVREVSGGDVVPALVAGGVAYTPVVGDRVLVSFVSGRMYIMGAPSKPTKAADADLLDGLDSQEFMRKGHDGGSFGGGRNTRQTSNLNQHLVSGWYDGNNMTGSPDPAQWWLVQVISHSNNALWQRQIAYSMTSEQSSRSVWMRRCNGGDPTVAGSWTAWKPVQWGGDVDGISTVYCSTGGAAVTPPANTDWRVPMTTSSHPDDNSRPAYTDGTGVVVKHAGIYIATCTMVVGQVDNLTRHVMLNVGGGWVAVQSAAYQFIYNLSWTGHINANGRVDVYVNVPSGTVGGGYYLHPHLRVSFVG